MIMCNQLTPVSFKGLTNNGRVLEMLSAVRENQREEPSAPNIINGRYVEASS